MTATNDLIEEGSERVVFTRVCEQEFNKIWRWLHDARNERYRHIGKITESLKAMEHSEQIQLAIERLRLAMVDQDNHHFDQLRALRRRVLNDPSLAVDSPGVTGLDGGRRAPAAHDTGEQNRAVGA